MPALKAIITGDAGGLDSELDRTLAKAEGWSTKFSSTISNKTQAQSAGDAYGKWWGEAMLKRDVEAATRSNRARRLLRERAARREAGGHGGRSGVIRESMVIIRELGRGDLKRAAGSASLLAQYLGLTKYLLNPITLGILAIVGGFFAAYKLAGALTQRLTGLKFPDFKPEYIAKHLQKLHQAAEGQKEINREIEKSIDLYTSASQAAERVSSATKEHYEHLKKMNEYEEETALAGAKTEAEKQAIRKKFSEERLKLAAQEREAEIKNKQSEADALAKESTARKQQADAIMVNSKEHDQGLINQRKQEADEAQKYLDEMANRGTWDKTKEKFVRGYNAVALTGVSGNDLDKAAKDNEKEARRRIQAHRDAVDQAAANDELRQKKSDLTKGAADSGAKAAEAFLKAGDMGEVARQKALDEKEEEAAKLKAEAAKDTKSDHPKLLRGHLTSLQQQGAFSGPAAAVTVHNKQLTVQQKILHHLEKNAKGGGGLNMGRVKF